MEIAIFRGALYFKEAKQHLGFLQEQTWTFASHTASIHLTAILYLLLVYAKHENEALRVCDIRSCVQDQLTSLDFAKHLWRLFRVLIHDALGDIKREIGGAEDTEMNATDSRVHDFFVKSLQLDAFTLKMEFK